MNTRIIQKSKCKIQNSNSKVFNFNLYFWLLTFEFLLYTIHMSDSGGGIQQASEEVVQTAGEVAQEVKDAVGESIEQGVQSVVGPKLTPQQIQQQQIEKQQKEAEDNKQISYVRNFLKTVDQEQKAVIEQNKQKEAQRLQNQQQEEQASEAKEEQKKQSVNPALANIGKVEIKGGVGG